MGFIYILIAFGEKLWNKDNFSILLIDRDVTTLTTKLNRVNHFRCKFKVAKPFHLNHTLRSYICWKRRWSHRIRKRDRPGL